MALSQLTNCIRWVQFYCEYPPDTPFKSSIYLTTEDTLKMIMPTEGHRLDGDLSFED